MLEQLALQATAVEAQEARSLANIPVDSTKLAAHGPSTRVQHKTHANSSRSPAMRPRALPILMLLPWAHLGPATSNLLHGSVNRIQKSDMAEERPRQACRQRSRSCRARPGKPSVGLQAGARDVTEAVTISWIAG